MTTTRHNSRPPGGGVASVCATLVPLLLLQLLALGLLATGQLQQQQQQQAPAAAGAPQVAATAPVAAKPLAPAPAPAAATAAAAPAPGAPLSDAAKFEAWKRHALFVAPFDPKVLALPELQLAFVRNMTASDLGLFREIAEEAIRIRNKWTPSVKLMFKYTGRLLGTFIRNRKAEQKLPLRVEPQPDFFIMLADLVQSVLDRSGAIKQERGYSKSSLDVDAFRARVFATFDYFQRMIDTSPLGGYLKWNEFKLFMDEPKNPLHGGDFVEEISDMAAQFRAMGYESTIFVGRRIVNLLRLFGRGLVPSNENEV